MSLFLCSVVGLHVSCDYSPSEKEDKKHTLTRKTGDTNLSERILEMQNAIAFAIVYIGFWEDNINYACGCRKQHRTKRGLFCAQ